jgi:hypothetical protein
VALNIQGILDVVVSHALSSGYFESINQYESKQSPSNGISGAVWVERVTPVKTSGLSNTSIRVELTFRMYSSTLIEPYDDIDPKLTDALDFMMAAYCADFELGSQVRHIDIFGAYGNPLESRSGYINLDGKEFRVFSVRLPLIVDDLWSQSP